MSRVNNSFMTPVSHPALPAKAAPGQLSATDIRKVLGLVGEIAPKEFTIFGNPIAHSRSPVLHNTLFQLTGLPHTYGRHETSDISELPSILRSPNFGGASVTIPIKLDVMPLLDAIDPAAKTIGAVNTIVATPNPASPSNPTLTGHNTDWQGMILALRNAGTTHVSATHPEPGMVVGGGGTARAAIYALKNMGYSPIYLVGRNKAKLTDLASAFDASYNVRLLASEADARALQPSEHPTVAIGTIPGDSPIDPSMREILCHIFQASAPNITGKGGIRDQKVLLEMAYKPAVTSLMQLASNSGWKAVPGLEALVGQGIHQFRLWTDIVPLFDVCREAVMGKAE